MPNSLTIASVMSSTLHAQHQQSTSSAIQDERKKGWHAQLDIRYASAGPKTVAKFQHEGPLRVLQSLYPEGDAVCHNVLVHPPSGLVGGDTLDIRLHLAHNAHALLTTPGATRFYRSEKGLATQRVQAVVQDGARLEWLPLETLAYNGCHGLNHAVFDLQGDAEMMAWDITALGLPNADLPFETGQLQQHLEVKGVWLERGLLDAQDHRLMKGPLGLAKHRSMAPWCWPVALTSPVNGAIWRCHWRVNAWTACPPICMRA